jgi:rhodanese-related sulfurtransferase
MSLERIALGVDDLLAEAREDLRRLTPAEAAAAMAEGTALIDMRDEGQVAADGRIPGATWIRRNVLEWRLEPGGADSIASLARTDRPLLLICDEGYQSSLAAANLTKMGHEAGDVIGGFQAWRDAGLPVLPPARPRPESPR